MIVLDTNIVSEVWRPKPHTPVLEWLSSQLASSLYLCTPVLAELRHGVERLANGRRKNNLKHAIDQLENEGYRDRILPFDTAAAAEFGRVMAQRERAGRRMRTMDALIAAIIVAHGASLASRDTGDFSDLGIELINPFELAG
jgi:toxin FitB